VIVLVVVRVRVEGIEELERVIEVLRRDPKVMRTRTMVERFKAWEATPPGDEPPPFARRGVLFGLATSIEPAQAWAGRPELPHGEDPLQLACFKTTFGKVDRAVAEALVHRGWWLAGATLSKFHSELLPAELPHWRDLPPTVT